MMIKGFYTTDSVSLVNANVSPPRVNSLSYLITVSPSASASGETTAGGVYNTVAPTLTNGSGSPLQLDVNGNLKVVEQFKAGAEDNSNNVIAVVAKPLAVSNYSPSLFTNFGANATLNIKATPGNIFSVTCLNVNAAVRYIQFHNTATTPAGGATPLLSFPIPASNGIVVLDQGFFTQGGIFFSTGIAFGFSTTAATYTAGTAAEQQLHVTYK